GDGALGRLVVGLQDQRPLAIAAGDAGGRVDGGDLPAPVLRPAEQGGEAGAGVEARPAEPVDGSVARDERRRLAVADQGVVLDARGHAVYAPSPAAAAAPGSPEPIDVRERRGP